MKVILALTLLLLLPVPGARAAMYVQGESLVLREGPSPSAKPRGELKKSEKVDVLETKGLWSRVKGAALEGWAPGISLSKQPPTGGSMLGGAGQEDFSNKARKRASSVVSAGAARGLREDGIAEKTLPRANYEALEKLRAFYVPPTDAKEFVRR